MAEAFQENTTVNTRTRISIVNRIYQSVNDNSLDEIKRILRPLPPYLCILILNTTINGCVPLYIAINLNNVEISQFLLDFSLLQGRYTMCEHWRYRWHPLFAALKGGNRKLITLILQNLYDINDTINGGYTALMIATINGDLESVKLIVTLKADVNRPCFQGRTPLMESTSNKEICKFLLISGANTNHQDDEGFTALHFALGWNNKETVGLLIHAGADARIKNSEGIDPLLWAAINQNEHGVEYLTQYPLYSIFHAVEAMEILGACYVCTNNTDMKWWTEALRKRRGQHFFKNGLIPAPELLDNSEEFTTETDLENIQDKPLLLAFQGILVVERILGRNSRVYLQCLLQTALIAKKENNMEKVRQLMNYINEYCKDTTTFIVAVNSSLFKDFFDVICKDSDAEIFLEFGGFAIYDIIAKALVKRWRQFKDSIYKTRFIIDTHYSDLVDGFLYMTSKIKTGGFFQQHLSLFREKVTEVVTEDPRVRLHQSILFRAISLMSKTPWGSVELIKILLESGADANCRDFFQRTPSMFAFEHVPEHIRNEVLDLLIEYGCSQLVKSKGSTAMDGILNGCD